MKKNAAPASLMSSGLENLALPDTGAASPVPNEVVWWVNSFRQRLGDWRFWVIQAMVMGVTIGHALGEIFEEDILGQDLGAVYFIPASLYFVPVIYASLNFGRAGAIPTAIWSALLAVPNVFIWHQGMERAGEAFQMSVMILLATVIAGRVDKEIAARREAETEERARRVSEMKFHTLFDSAAEPIVVLDGNGIVQEVNAAAAELFGQSEMALAGKPLTQVLGSEGAQAIQAAAHGSDAGNAELRIKTATGAEIWVEPLCAHLPDVEGPPLVQVMLRDVTEKRGLQSYAREIIRAQEEERARIARELHDVGLQSVILFCRQLDTAGEVAGPDLPEPVQAALGEARRTAEGIADELRRFSRDLRPVVLEDLGLVPAVRRLVSETSTLASVRGRFVVTGDPRRLPADAELSIFRIVQEALRNVGRHSTASHVTVRLWYQADAVRVIVRDDGQGFKIPVYTALASGGKLGLLGMRERARLVGGTCDILSSPGKGTRVEVSIPS